MKTKNLEGDVALCCGYWWLSLCSGIVSDFSLSYFVLSTESMVACAIKNNLLIIVETWGLLYYSSFVYV